MPTNEAPQYSWRSHLRAVLQLPFLVAVVVPAILLYLTGLDTFGLRLEPQALQWFVFAAGIFCVAAGVAVVVATIRLFAVIGRGTLAPFHPTQRLVVIGPYQHSRNPMYLGVFAILLGEALLAASWALLAWFVVFTLHKVVQGYRVEERSMLERFGDEYAAYQSNVPRWIPRRTPWTTDGQPPAGGRSADSANA